MLDILLTTQNAGLWPSPWNQCLTAPELSPSSICRRPVSMLLYLLQGAAIKESSRKVNMDVVLDTLSPALLHLSLAIITFYRKSFTFRSHGVLCLSSSLFFLHSLSPVPSLLLPILLTTITLKEFSKHLTSLDLQDSYNLLAMLLLLLHLSNPHPMQKLWLLPLLLSPLQLLRRPTSLSHLLRPLRVAADPVYILTALLAAALQIRQDCSQFLVAPSLPLLLSLLASTTVLLSAATAGVVFRPDNIQVLQLLLPTDKVCSYFLVTKHV